MPQETLFNSDIDRINAQLAKVYGLEVRSNRPVFRIVNSAKTTEKRLGVFRDFTESGIFIREVKEVREVLKYNYLKDTWVLEKLVWIGGRNPELPEARGYNYECMWAFLNAKKEPLYPHFNIVELFISLLLNGPREKKTENDVMYEEEQRKIKEAEEYFEILKDQGRSDLFAFEDSVFLDATKRDFATEAKEVEKNVDVKLGSTNLNFE